MKTSTSDNISILITFFGIILFALLYVLATILYPGGSINNQAAQHFSWLHNYWCDLMDSHSKNGVLNTAQPIAITAIFVLSISLGFFWYNFTQLFISRGRFIIRYSGILSVLLMTSLVAGPHDPVIYMAGLSGITAITGALIVLYQERLYIFFVHGLFCVVLCLINNYIYYTGHLLYALPVVQKISFLFFLIWFFRIAIYLFRKAKSIIPTSVL